MASHKEPDANAGNASGALARLARRVGIEPHFVNAMGETVVTPAAVQSALLTAMGLAAADEREAEARLAELDAEEWSQPLPPVVVLHAAEQPARIPIALPPLPRPLRWTAPRRHPSKAGRWAPRMLTSNARGKRVSSGGASRKSVARRGPKCSRPMGSSQ